MKYHINNTKNPITYKTWALDHRLVKPNHFKILHSHNISARIEMDNNMTFTASNGSSWAYAGTSRAELETYSEEQEVVIQLLYSDQLTLMQVQTVMPNTILYDLE